MAAHSQEKFVVLTEGYSNPVTAKTGASFIRYRTDDVLAVLDAEHAGKMAAEILDAGPNIPVVATLEETPEANALLIGTAPTGGRLPEAWRTVVRAALQRGMHVVSGLHDFLGDDPELRTLAAECGAKITDVRQNAEQDVSIGEPLGNDCLRIHTMGNDCSLGKMVVTIELDRALRKQGHDSKFLATGQTGIMISGDGVPIDRVIADFVSGAAEKMVLRNKQHDFLLIEGQGSLAHPMYSAVTLGLLHGCQPQGLILCYEAGRELMGGVKDRRLVSLTQLRQACETIGHLVHPTEAIGVAMNGRRLSTDEAEQEKRRVRDELGLPVCDVFRDGPDVLVLAILDLRERLTS